jgi:hypothetical protein
MSELLAPFEPGATKETLHLWAQIVARRLAATPPQNHCGTPFTSTHAADDAPPA